jgi:hypothetical protein
LALVSACLLLYGWLLKILPELIFSTTLFLVLVLVLFADSLSGLCIDSIYINVGKYRSRPSRRDFSLYDSGFLLSRQSDDQLPRLRDHLKLLSRGKTELPEPAALEGDLRIWIGLPGADIGQAISGVASPYLAEQIHKLTEGNPEAQELPERLSVALRVMKAVSFSPVSSTVRARS